MGRSDHAHPLISQIALASQSHKMAAIPTAGAVDPGLVTAYPTRLSSYHEDVDLTTPNSPSSDDKHEKTRSFDDNTVIEDGPHVTHLAGGGYIENKSKGVVEMESLKERVNLKFLIILYGSFALLAYVLSLSESHRRPDARHALICLRPSHRCDVLDRGRLSIFPAARSASHNQHYHRGVPGNESAAHCQVRRCVRSSQRLPRLCCFLRHRLHHCSFFKRHCGVRRRKLDLHSW